MRFPNFKAVLFDIDGTLVDSNDYHVQAWEQALSNAGHPIPTAVLRKQMGKGADMLLPALLPQSDEALRKRLAASHDEIFESRYLPRVVPFAQATALLVSLQQRGVRVVLASSARASEVAHYVKLLDVASIVAATTSADDVQNSKPAGDIFASALQTVQPIKAADALVVGDTPYDVQAANECGISTIGLRSGGFLEEELTGAGAIAVYADVAALMDAMTAV